MSPDQVDERRLSPEPQVPLRTTPVVSVVIPCLGRGGLLRECLESLREQEFEGWEAIVIDDGTPTTEVEDAVLSLDDPRVRYVRQPANHGLAAARNAGFRAATAPLVLTLDSDDKLHPSFLTKTLGAFRDHPSADCVFTDFRVFGDVDGVWPKRAGSLRDMLMDQWIPGPGTLQRRAIWDAVGGFCEPPMMGPECEWDFWLSACERGISAVHLPEPLYFYRRHEGHMSAGTLMREAEQRELLYRRHRSTFDAFHLGGEFRALGYLTSSAACSRDGDRRQALRLALRGLCLRPMDRRLWRRLIGAVLPRSWIDGFRAGAEAGRRG